MKDSFDLIVVGSGVVGTLTALQAHREQPLWRILLLDRSDIASGATCYSAGVDFRTAPTVRHGELMQEGQRLQSTLIDCYSMCFRTVPLLYVVRTSFEDDIRPTIIPDICLASNKVLANLNEFIPDLILHPDERVLHSLEPATVTDAPLLCHQIVNGLKSRDVLRVRTHETVTDVSEAGGNVLVKTASNVYCGKRVVLATGAWHAPIASFATPSDEPRFRRKRVVALHAKVRNIPTAPLIYFPDDDLFVRPDGDGRALVSFRSERWDVDMTNVDTEPDSDDLRAGRIHLSRRSCEMASNLTGGQAHVDLYSVGRVPAIRALGNSGRVIWVGACSGSGVRLGAGLAVAAFRALEAGHA